LYQIAGCAVKRDKDYVLTLKSGEDESQVEILLEGEASARVINIKNFTWGMDKDIVFKLQ
jgi:hypothetical protein